MANWQSLSKYIFNSKCWNIRVQSNKSNESQLELFEVCLMADLEAVGGIWFINLLPKNINVQLFIKT